MSSIEDRIRDDIKSAMKGGRKDELEVLRTLMSDAKNLAIAGGGERTGLPDDLLLRVLRRGIKTRSESAETYAQAGRDELAERERFQIGVIEAYLPAGATEEEVAAVVDAVLAELGGGDKSVMGRVMKESLARLEGRADGKLVQRLVASRLG